jgi:hypothetical protein
LSIEVSLFAAIALLGKARSPVAAEAEDGAEDGAEDTVVSPA